MLNVIFSMELLEVSEEGQRVLSSAGVKWVAPLPECKELVGKFAHQALVNDMATTDSLKAYLEGLGATPEIIGVWHQESGAQYGYLLGVEVLEDGSVNTTVTRALDEDGVPIAIPYPYNQTKYHEILADIVTYDVDGVETLRRRPTHEEAQSTQVNLWSGQVGRDLTVYV